MKIQPIFTPRLFIREFELFDRDDIYEYSSDNDVVKYMIWGPNTLDETEKFLQEKISTQQQTNRKKYELAVVIKGTKKVIGGCSFELTNEGILVGYVFNKDYWGNGYATEVTASILKLSAKVFGINKFIATCDEENIGSRMVLEKNGFEMTKRIVRDIEVRGRLRNTCVFEREISAENINL